MDDVEEYVRNCLDEGYSPGRIKKTLLNSGYSEGRIDSVLNSVAEATLDSVKGPSPEGEKGGGFDEGADEGGFSWKKVGIIIVVILLILVAALMFFAPEYIPFLGPEDIPSFDFGALI